VVCQRLPGNNHGRFPAQTAKVLAQRFEQIRAQHDIPILAAFAALHVNHVAATVYIRDLQPGEFGAPEACGMEGHEQSALKRRGRGFDETVDFFSSEDGRKMYHLLRVRCLVGAPRFLQCPDVEEPDSAQVLDDGVGLKLSFESNGAVCARLRAEIPARLGRRSVGIVPLSKRPSTVGRVCPRSCPTAVEAVRET
jgi:hypothetical protein